MAPDGGGNIIDCLLLVIEAEIADFLLQHFIAIKNKPNRLPLPIEFPQQIFHQP
jgi:hypothetical protein